MRVALAACCCNLPCTLRPGSLPLRCSAVCSLGSCLATHTALYASPSRWWWWELVDMSSKLFLTSILVFFGEAQSENRPVALAALRCVVVLTPGMRVDEREGEQGGDVAALCLVALAPPCSAHLIVTVAQWRSAWCGWLASSR
jgi:hypothetical protein